MAVILQKFGDEESTLFDRYERLSFEVQLNQAILGRSLSEPSTLSGRRRQAAAAITMPPPPPPPQSHQANCGGDGGGRRRRKLRLHKILQKLLKPILGRTVKKDVRDLQKDINLWKTFSRSLRHWNAQMIIQITESINCASSYVKVVFCRLSCRGNYFLGHYIRGWWYHIVLILCDHRLEQRESLEKFKNTIAWNFFHLRMVLDSWF